MNEGQREFAYIPEMDSWYDTKQTECKYLEGQISLNILCNLNNFADSIYKINLNFFYG